MEKMHSIQKFDRIAGGLYLLITILSIFVHFVVPAQLIVAGDAETTATKIIASMGLFRMDIAAELVLLLSDIGVSVLLYILLKPVNKTLALVAAVSRLAMTAIEGINLLNHFIVLILLSGSAYLTVFATNQLHALAMVFLDTYGYGFKYWDNIFHPSCFSAWIFNFQVRLLPQNFGRLVCNCGFRLSNR